MSIGIAVNKSSVDAQVGRVCADFMNALESIAALDDSLSPYDSAALQAFGYTSGEAALIGSIRADLNQLRTIAMGLATLSPAKDFRTFARQAAGIRS